MTDIQHRPGDHDMPHRLMVRYFMEVREFSNEQARDLTRFDHLRSMYMSMVWLSKLRGK